MADTHAPRRSLAHDRADLPAALADVVDEFERHLRLERDLSAHTVRAYRGDVVSLLAHFCRVCVGEQGAAVQGIPGLNRLDLSMLRSWLAALHAEGISRTTLARRSAAARTFTAWATRAGHLATDP